MKVVVFGATGMVGQGVLRECLNDDEIVQVLVVGRQETRIQNDKLREIIHQNFFDLSAISNKLTGLDACFYCLGVSAVGKTEADYRRTTFDMTMAAASALLAANPDLTFEYVSGQGTGGKAMWARVKAETENSLLQMPFKAAYMFRPGVIIPLDGIKSKTAWYRILYSTLRPLLPLLKKVAPRSVTDTRQFGRAMIRVAKFGASKRVLEMEDIA